MSDHDRGAYTPQSEAPLAFDARRPSERRPLPMTLIASGGVLMVILVALVMAYRSGVRGAGDPKAVGTPVAAIKTAPGPEAAQASDPAARLDVYAAQNVPAQAPNFAPAPEQPQPRAAPVASPAAGEAPRLQVHTVPPAKVRIGPPEPAATPVPVPTPAERTAAATSRTAIPAGAADRPVARPIQLARAEPVVPAPPLRETAKLAPAAPKAEPPAPVTAKPKAAATGGTAVQIGAFSSRALAAKGYADAAGLIGARMAGHGRSVETVERDGKTFYRATLTGFPDHATAQAFCEDLASKGGRCLVKSGG